MGAFRQGAPGQPLAVRGRRRVLRQHSAPDDYRVTEGCGTDRRCARLFPSWQTVGASDEAKSGLKTRWLSSLDATLHVATRMLGGGLVNMFANVFISCFSDEQGLATTPVWRGIATFWREPGTGVAS